MQGRWSTVALATATLGLLAIATRFVSPFMVQFIINLFMLAVLAES